MSRPKIRGRRRGEGAEVVALVLGFSLATMFFLSVSSDYVLKSEAVRRGFAYWRVDAAGATEFQWKPSPAGVELEEAQP